MIKSFLSLETSLPKHRSRRPKRGLLLLSLFAFAAAAAPAHAASGRLIATGGATTIEGNAGGGIVPLALIAGLGTRDEIGYTGFAAGVKTDDYHVLAGGAAVGFYDRFELSAGRLGLNFADSRASALPGNSLVVDTIGLKARLAGDAVYSPDRLLPQLAFGMRYQKNRDSEILDMVGAEDDGVDFYLAATKLYFAGAAGRNLLVNGVVRLTKANQLGLLGFGGDGNDDYEPQAEGSLTVFLNRSTILGVEYRMKPDNIDALGIKEDDWWDVFLGWFPTKHFGIVAAYTDLGTIALDSRQRGAYLSLQLTY